MVVSAQLIIGLLVGALAGLAAGLSLFQSRAKKTLQEKEQSLNQSLKESTNQNQKLQQSESMFQQILENIQDSVLVLNPGDALVWMNNKAQLSLKLSPSTLGQPITETLPDFANHKNSQSFQVKKVSLDGEDVVYNAKVFNLRGVGAESAGKILVLRDVTENLAVEEMKLDFVAIAAHQLRTPLTSIKGYLSVLKEMTTGRLDASQEVFLQRAIISTDRLGSLIENLMSVSRIERGALKINFLPVDVEYVVKQTVDSLKQAASGNQVDISVDTKYTPYPEIRGDAALLQEALTNVVSNAIKYNHPGGQVSVTLEKQPLEITIFVSDNGKGIPAKALPYLFQRFYRATNSLTELSSGLGLGLFISKSIIDAHRGKIWVNSLEGRGTTVGISLPVAP